MTLIHKFVEECRAGIMERCLGRTESGWAVMGDPQVREGYCMLYPDPVVASLNELTGAARTQFLEDMGRLGDAVLAVTKAERINYEILGNLEPALHAHVVPRWSTEPPIIRHKPIWFEDFEAASTFDMKIHAELHAALKKELGF